MKRLPDTELEVMKALWQSGPNTPRATLEEALSAHRWASNTVNTYLSRLTEKGFVACQKQGKANLYTPLISQEDYLSFESRHIFRLLYNNSPKNFVAALAKGGLNRREVDELRALLDELSGGPEGE